MAFASKKNMEALTAKIDSLNLSEVMRTLESLADSVSALYAKVEVFQRMVLARLCEIEDEEKDVFDAVMVSRRMTALDENEDDVFDEEDKEEAQRIDELAKMWDAVRDEIYKKEMKLCSLLNEEDAALLAESRLEDKIAAVNGISASYDNPALTACKRYAEWLETNALPRLKEIQDMV